MSPDPARLAGVSPVEQAMLLTPSLSLRDLLMIDLKEAGIPDDLLMKHVDRQTKSVNWRRAANVWTAIGTDFCAKFLAAVLDAPPSITKPHKQLFVLLDAVCREHNRSFGTLNRVLPLFPSVQGAPTLACAAKLKSVANRGKTKPRYDEFWDIRPVLQFLADNRVPVNDEQAVRDRLILVLRFSHLFRNTDEQRIPREYIQKVDASTFRILVAPKQPGRLVYDTRYVLKVEGAPWYACPARLLEHYLLLTETVKTGTLFVYLATATKPGERRPLSASRIGAIVRKCLGKAGVDTRKYKPHSTRGPRCLMLSTSVSSPPNRAWRGAIGNRKRRRGPFILDTSAGKTLGRMCGPAAPQPRTTQGRVR